MPGETIRLVDTQGQIRDVPVEAAGAALEGGGWRVPTHEEESSRVAAQAREAEYGGAGGAIKAGLAGAARGVSLGLSDVAARALGGEDTAIALQGLREENPVISAGSEIAGALAPTLLSAGASTPASAAAAAGRGVVESVGGLGGRIAGGALEGALYGAGSGVSELALSRDPLTFERAASTISSHALFGAAAGAVTGGVAGSVERGLARAKGAIDEFAAARAARDAIAPDLAELDAKGLRAAQELELGNIETARVPQRQQIADDLAAFRKQAKDDALFLATKGIKEDGINVLGKRTLKADQALDRLLDNPKALASRPQRALDALQQQESALEGIAEKADQLRIRFAADTSGDRVAALEKIPAALEQNRALQARIAQVVAEPTSERLTAIAAAKDALSTPAPPKGIIEQAFGGTAFGAITGAASAIPVLGQIPGVAHFIGAKGAELAAKVVFGRLGSGIAGQAERASAAVGAFLGASKAASPYAPVIATKVLGALRYAPERGGQEPSGKSTTLASAYKARTDEIKSQTAYDATGIPRMRPEARAAIGERLKPVRAVDPILADRIETIAARRLEYLSGLIPRRPDIAGVQIGPDHWQPSDMAMRTWARSAAAVEDPDGVLERAAHGAVTPEDADALRNVYPEKLADFTQQVAAGLPTLRETLPYARRLSLSILTGQPVDPSMDPAIMRVFQAQFQYEPEQPRAQPQFGSVKNRTEVGTASQRREEGTA